MTQLTQLNEDPAQQRILVVDDEPAIRELVVEVLMEEGYEVAAAANGSEALQTLTSSEPFDLVVLDMWMPLLNGWQFAAALSERGMQLPIVVMTAAREARERAEEIGAVGYIGKPFDVDQFVETIRTAIDADEKPGDNVLRSVYTSTVRAAALRMLPQFSGASRISTFGNPRIA